MADFTYPLAAFLILVLLAMYKKEKPMEFTLCFIFIISLIIYSITTEFLPVVLAIAGLIFAHHSVQPFFYPVAVKSTTKNKYITSHYTHFPPFTDESDPRGEKPKFDFYLHSDETFVIKVPLFPIFRSIKIDFPGTKEVRVAADDLTTYSVVPFIDIPEAKGNSIKLKVKASAWTITEVRYPVKFQQKLEKEPRVGFAWGISFYYPYTEEKTEPLLSLVYKPINKKDEYGILVDFFNHESVPIQSYQCVGKGSIEDSEVWKKFDRDHVQVQYPNGDIIGLYKGYFYCWISAKIKPMERRYYYISSKGEGKLVEFNWPFSP